MNHQPVSPTAWTRSINILLMTLASTTGGRRNRHALERTRPARRHRPGPILPGRDHRLLSIGVNGSNGSTAALATLRCPTWCLQPDIPFLPGQNS